MNFADIDKPERKKLRKRFVKEPYCKRGKRMEFEDYSRQTAESYFVLSPEGLGPDCYRTWEALLCGAIPIIKTSPLDPLFEGLPILIIKSWHAITETYLKEQYRKITSQTYDIKRLYCDYWFNKIEVVKKRYRKGLEC